MPIRLLVSDIDGVVTDGRLLLGAKGLYAVSISIHDTEYVSRLRQTGIKVCFISGSSGEPYQSLGVRFGVDECFLGITDKFTCLARFLEANEIGWADVAYVGDGLCDVECMRAAKLRFSPANSIDNVALLVPDCMVIPACGGHGVLVEVATRLLRESA